MLSKVMGYVIMNLSETIITSKATVAFAYGCFLPTIFEIGKGRMDGLVYCIVELFRANHRQEAEHCAAKPFLPLQ